MRSAVRQTLNEMQRSQISAHNLTGFMNPRAGSEHRMHTDVVFSDHVLDLVPPISDRQSSEWQGVRQALSHIITEPSRTESLERARLKAWSCRRSQRSERCESRSSAVHWRCFRSGDLARSPLRFRCFLRLAERLAPAPHSAMARFFWAFFALFAVYTHQGCGGDPPATTAAPAEATSAPADTTAAP